MRTNITIRQDIWQAAYSVLRPDHTEAEARMFANAIVERFCRSRRLLAGTYPVQPEMRAEIGRLLMSGMMGQLKIAKQLGVGTSTVQRIADELEAQGLLPPVRLNGTEESVSLSTTLTVQSRRRH